MTGFAGGKGLYSGTLATTPDGTQFGLFLEIKKGQRWGLAATGSTNAAILYNGASGNYRWRITGPSGSSYALCSVVP